jgi:hypothetical protein
MNKLWGVWSVVSMLSAFTAAGCGEVVCGEGTHTESDSCVANLSPSCGAGTRLENGACIPDEGGGAECGEGTHANDNGECVPDVDLSGNASRFYEVNLTDPVEFVPIANGPFHDAFKTGENLIFIGAYTPSADQVRFYGGTGSLDDDGTYSLDHDVAFDTSASGPTDGMMTSAPFTFRMRAFGAPQPIVLVDTVITNGTMGAPERITLVQSGKLQGVLTPENARAVYIQDANSNLEDLINALEIKPDKDVDHDGTKESWTMGVTFETVPVWLF